MMTMMIIARERKLQFYFSAGALINVQLSGTRSDLSISKPLSQTIKKRQEEATKKKTQQQENDQAIELPASQSAIQAAANLK